MAFDWDQFFRGLAGGAASGLALGRQARALNVEEQKGALALETARGEIADFKTFSDYSRELNAGIESEGQRLGSSQTANELSGKLVSDLALDEPGSPERKLAVGALPKQTDPLVRTYLVSASGKSLHNLHQASIEDDDFGVEQFRRVLTHPGAAAEAVTRARAAAEAREADPVGYGFQIQMKLLGHKAEKLTAARDRGWQVYTQMRPGSKAQAAMETLITGLDRQLSALETQRNNLSSPQFSTFAQGAEEVTQLVDPQTGELLPVGRAERPVYLQQRGAEMRAAAAAGQREAQFQQREAAVESRFLRKPAAQGFQMSYDAEGRPVVSYGQAPKLTEGQAKAVSLGLRGGEATDQLLALEASGYRPGFATQAQQWAGSQLGARNRFLDPSGQQYEQALLNFGTAIGRFESGAAIPETEWERFVQQYGAQPGDSDEVIRQKQQNRDTAMRGVGIAAGPGLQPALEPAPIGAGTGSITNRTREMQPATSPETEARRQRAVEALRRRGVAGY